MWVEDCVTPISHVRCACLPKNAKVYFSGLKTNFCYIREAHNCAGNE